MEPQKTFKTPITPTVGRMVHYYSPGCTQPSAAIIAFVHSDRLINISLIGPDGVQCGLTSVALVHPGDPVPDHCHCRWMDYQIGQAEKAEELKAALEKLNTGPRTVGVQGATDAELNKIKQDYLDKAASVNKS